MTIELPFSRDEYATRLAKTKKAMEQKGIDLLIVTDPSNMAWLTGYDGWSFYVHQCVLIPMNEEPIWYGRAQDGNGAKRTVYMDHSRIIGYEDHYVQSTERHPMDYLSSVITDRGWSSQSIGVEMDNYYFSAAAYASLVKYLPNAKFTDATAMVNWQRAIKSRQELKYMRTAAKISEAMHTRVLEKVAPGVRKNDLVAEITDAAYRGVDGKGGEYSALIPLLPTGADAAAPHLTWDDKPLKAGEGTFFELSGVYKRYHCPLCRTVYLGKPPQHFLDAEKAIQEGLAAGIEKARAGNAVEEVALEFFAALKRYGLVKDSRCGYPIGLSYPPDWGERTYSLRRGEKTELQPGMTFHFMTGLWQDDWGFEITESLHITDGEPEVFCDFSRELFIID